MSDPYAILVLCSRLDNTGTIDGTAVGQPFVDVLRQSLVDFHDWSTLINLAEQHNMAPLLYHHLRAANVPLPAQTKLQLQGLTLRHRQSNKIRASVLTDIATQLQQAEIQMLVLKGGALAFTVYPEAGLRPMSDLDILVSEKDVLNAYAQLRDGGFVPSTIAAPTPEDHHHLPVLTIERDGLTVSLEIHRQLTSSHLTDPPPDWDTLWETAVSITVDRQIMHTLHPVWMLWHLHQHMLAETTRLIRIVDIVSVAEHHINTIDWDDVQLNHPAIIAMLTNLHFVMPLSQNLQQAIGQTPKHQPQGTAHALQDWPPLPRLYWSGKTRKEILQTTFFPSELTLRLFYGISSDRPCWRQRWLTHPANIIKWWLARRTHRL